MFKNMKLAAKIGVGFGILVVISGVLGFIGWNGLSNVASNAELNRGGNDSLEQLNQCASLRKEFAIRGFEKYGSDNKTAAENWQEAYDKLLTQLKGLEGSRHIAAADKAIITDTIGKMPVYRASFDDQKEARTMKDTAFSGWGQVGWDVTKEVAAVITNVIEPGRKAAEQARDVNEITKWNEIGSSLDETVVQQFLTLRVTAVYLLATNKEEQWTAYQTQLGKVKTNIEGWANLVRGNESLEAVAKRIEDLIRNYEASGVQYHNGMLAQASADAAMATNAKAIVDGIGRLQSSLQGKMQQTTAWTNALMITMAISGIILGVVLAIVITLSIVKPIGRIIAGLTDGAEQVAAAAGQVSSASQSLAEGATEQAAGLQETSSSLEEMASMTKKNADNAQQANGLASDAKKAAHTGSESMNRMNAAIQEIQKSSDETSKIIKVIDEIAFQTNLLALNAAVEAARAGEAGKGFAVVAEEVRNLAMRSAEAAKNTSNMIEESVKNAKNGVDIATEVGKVLNEIVQSVGKTTDLVGEIAAASQEQSQGIDQVNTAVAQMDKVTQQNAANAEESASASEELSSQAESMNQIVGELVALVGGSRKFNASQTTRKTSRHAGVPGAQGMTPKSKDILPQGKKSTKLSASDRVFHKIAGRNEDKTVPVSRDDLDAFNS